MEHNLDEAPKKQSQEHTVIGTKCEERNELRILVYTLTRKHLHTHTHTQSAYFASVNSHNMHTHTHKMHKYAIKPNNKEKAKYKKTTL